MSSINNVINSFFLILKHFIFLVSLQLLELDFFLILHKRMSTEKKIHNLKVESYVLFGRHS